MTQMAANQEQLQQMMDQRMAEAAAMSAEAAAASAEAAMSQLFGEDMGVLAAALETLAMEGDEEGLGFDEEEETAASLYALLDETMARLETLP